MLGKSGQALGCHLCIKYLAFIPADSASSACATARSCHYIHLVSTCSSTRQAPEMPPHCAYCHSTATSN